MTQYHNLIVVRRLTLGLSLSQTARRAGLKHVTPALIDALELRHCLPSGRTAAALAHALRISFDADGPDAPLALETLAVISRDIELGHLKQRNAARLLGHSRPHLLQLFRDHGIQHRGEPPLAASP